MKTLTKLAIIALCSTGIAFGQISNPGVTLTTTGSSGPATITNGNPQVLNIPVYSGGGGSVSITSSTGDLTVSPSPLTGTGTIDLNLGNANTWTALQTFGTDISIGGVTAAGATGTGNIVFATSPTFTTPALGTPASGVITNLTGTCTACTANTITSQGTAATVNTGTSGATIPLNNGNNTFSGNLSFTGAAAASTPIANITGTWSIGGSATTNFPQLYLNGGATQPTTFATTGEAFGINAPSGYTGQFLQFWVNGAAAVFTVNNGGTLTTGGSVQSNSGYESASGKGYGFSSTTSGAGTIDTQVCRAGAAGTTAFESAATCTNTVAGATGVVIGANFQSGGTKFTATGCTTISATTGGASAGKFTIGQAGTCTVVVTTGITATNGWSCKANDETTPAGNTGLYFSTNNGTTATLSVPAGAGNGDVFDFFCMAY